jgi:protein ImuB
LRRAGLKTIGDVASREPREIAARFGKEFTDLLREVLGQCDAPISPRRPPPDFMVERRFAEPVATEDTIAATVSGLAQKLMVTMERQGKGARRLEASFFRVDGAVRTIAVDAGQPVRRSGLIDRLFRERFDALADPLDPGFGFDLIRLSASRVDAVVQEQRDLDARTQDNDEVAALIDRLAARLGRQRIMIYLPQDTHVPECAALALPAQQHFNVASVTEWPERVAKEPPLRPLRLFKRPEEIKVTAASVPDGPPPRFTWRRASHAVVRAEGPERIAMEWWKNETSTFTRDYFRVEDTEGLRFWIYRDGLYGSELVDDKGERIDPKWFVHGVFA